MEPAADPWFLPLVLGTVAFAGAAVVLAAVHILCTALGPIARLSVRAELPDDFCHTG